MLGIETILSNSGPKKLNQLMNKCLNYKWTWSFLFVVFWNMMSWLLSVCWLIVPKTNSNQCFKIKRTKNTYVEIDLFWDIISFWFVLLRHIQLSIKGKAFVKFRVNNLWRFTFICFWALFLILVVFLWLQEFDVIWWNFVCFY